MIYLKLEKAIASMQQNNNLPIEVKENNFFKKLITYIKNLFRKKEE